MVLTPAVAAAVKTAKVKNPLPYLFICALIANAASFVLPISNPANLVIYGGHMPPLLQWLPRFAIPSVLSILATFVILRLTQRRALKAEETVAKDVDAAQAVALGKLAAAGIALTAVALLASSGLGLQLGLPTAICGVLTAFAVMILKRASPWEMLKGISWGVLPLVAGLFVLVEALDKTGLIRTIGDLFATATEQLGDRDRLGRGRPHRFRLQSDEQPSGRPHCGQRGAGRPCAGPGHKRHRWSASISARTFRSPGHSPPSSGSPRSGARTSMSAPGPS